MVHLVCERFEFRLEGSSEGFAEGHHVHHVLSLCDLVAFFVEGVEIFQTVVERELAGTC